MDNNDILISVGFDRKYGGFNFSVRRDIVELSLVDMERLREMTVIAVGTMEEIWRRGQEERITEQPVSAPSA